MFIENKRHLTLLYYLGTITKNFKQFHMNQQQTESGMNIAKAVRRIKGDITPEKVINLLDRIAPGPKFNEYMSRRNPVPMQKRTHRNQSVQATAPAVV